MFSTLESNWDQSAHQGQATLASFAMQALGLSLLLAIPLLTIQGPPKLQRFDCRRQHLRCRQADSGRLNRRTSAKD